MTDRRRPSSLGQFHVVNGSTNSHTYFLYQKGKDEFLSLVQLSIRSSTFSLSFLGDHSVAIVDATYCGSVVSLLEKFLSRRLRRVKASRRTFKSISDSRYLMMGIPVVVGFLLLSWPSSGVLTFPSTNNNTPSHRQISPSLECLIRLPNDFESFLFVRGGSTDLVNEEEDDETNAVVAKVRNMVRNLLKLGDKKVPLVSSLLRKGLKVLEGITGIRLLPKPKPKKSKKNEKKGASKKKKAAPKEDKGETTTSEADQGSTSQDKVETEEGGGVKDEKTEKKMSSPKVKKPSATTQKHLTTNIKSNNPTYRIQRELKEFLASKLPNLSVQVGSNIRIWIVTMTGAKNTIYEGEVFKLRVQFPKEYPVVPPSVYFLQGYVPSHEHVYTNGDICLSLLGKDWKPTMTAQSIAMSILSILSSAQSKSIPMDNARHATNKPGQFQKDWVYHDDNC
jgi:ubiquitin-conjugating enzyme E2 W